MAGAVHVRALRRDRAARLIVVADPDPGARARGAALGRAAGDRDLAAVLRRPEVEAVVVAAPSPHHAELATEVLAAGRHLYLEKPVATDVAGAERVEAAARSAPELVAVVGYNGRAHPLCRRARELVRGGAIGSLCHFQARFGEPAGAGAASWRTGAAGGVVLDLADHHVDLIGWLTDDPVVQADVDARPDRTEATVRMRTAAGVRGQGLYSTRSARVHDLELLGTEGTLRLDRYSTRLELTRPRGAPGQAALRRARPSSSRRPEPWRLRRLVRPAHDPSWAASLHAFALAVRGTPHDLATVADGARNVALLLG